jgi:hypothetical protein
MVQALSAITPTHTVIARGKTVMNFCWLAMG